MKKIMFSDKLGLTKSVLEGKKTMTRRIINPQPTYDTLKGMYWKGGYYGLGLITLMMLTKTLFPEQSIINLVTGTVLER